LTWLAEPGTIEMGERSSHVEGSDVVRCAAHALAAGPDGLCVLCRRARQPVTPTSEPRAGALAAKLLTWSLAVGMVAGAVLVYQMSARGELQPTGSTEAVVAPRPRALTPTPRATPKPGSLPGRSQRSLDELDPGHLLHAPQANRADLPSTDPRPLDAAAREQREDEARDQARRASIQADIRARDLKAARRNVSIAMYSTTWCPSCVKARTYMRERGIGFVDYDVDHDERAQQRAHRLNPKNSIPTIDIDGQVMVGFSADSLEASIQRSAEKRASR
jgi:glutaredoxin 3